MGSDINTILNFSEGKGGEFIADVREIHLFSDVREAAVKTWGFFAGNNATTVAENGDKEVLRRERGYIKLSFTFMMVLNITSLSDMQETLPIVFDEINMY